MFKIEFQNVIQNMFMHEFSNLNLIKPVRQTCRVLEHAERSSLKNMMPYMKIFIKMHEDFQDVKIKTHEKMRDRDIMKM